MINHINNIDNMTIKRQEQTRKPISVTLDQDVVEWLNKKSKGGSRAEFVNSVLKMSMNIELKPEEEVLKTDVQKIFEKVIKKRGPGRPKKVPVKPIT